jgi:hypothetical protein
LIELSGNLAGTSSGLVTATSNCIVRGRIINRFQGNGAQIEGGSGNRIEGTYIGTDATVTTALANLICGVAIFGASGNNTIGGIMPEHRNIISGNMLHGVQVSLGSLGGNAILRDYIGLDVTGRAVLGNSDLGVYLGAPNDTVGGFIPEARNVISGSGSYDIYVAESSNGRLLASRACFRLAG